ncbi:MAG: MBL fold metallo-hydrolase [Granulosicoccaceae bacterium]|jgi:glyoxylase-like metal-dependent hydrolase (beta-lactamase superfamily II)
MRNTVTLVLVLLLSACTDREEPPAQAVQLTPYPPSSVEMEVQQVSKHVYYVQGAAGVATDNEGFISNAGFVVTGDGVVVFDSLGSPSLAQKMLGKIREITDQPVRRVIVSHYHADHIYGLPLYRELGAEIYAPAGSSKYIDSPQAIERLEERRFSLSPWVDERTYVVKPDHFLSQSTQFSLGDVDFTVSIVGAAHSDDDLTLYVEPDRVLFSGDIIFEGRVAYLGDADTKRWLETLEKMETDQLVALIPGHGPAASDPNAAISQTRRYLAYLREQMGRAVDELQDFDSAYAATDWSEFENLPAFEAANRRNAYQVYLSIEREQLGTQ